MKSKENTVGKVLKEARLEKGLTQAALGTLLGYSAMAISHFENGTRPIRTEELTRASEVLGCNLMEKQENASTSATFFRATNLRGGSIAQRSLQAFDKYIEKKYGADTRTKGNN